MGHENGGWMNDDQRDAMRDAASQVTKAAKPTAGPWRLGCHPDWNWDDTIPVVSGGRPAEIVVACVWPIAADNSYESPEAQANGHLIAAAPDAHEILESIHEFFRDGGPVNPSAMFDETHTYKQAVEAYLAKATGWR